MKYIVEVWNEKHNCFVLYSSHRNKSNAEVSCEVVGKSRKQNARIIYRGKVVGVYNHG
jgi:hypothetical protein